ncbi:MAG TPA: signal peptide peptidase SppA [Mycobacteriales bacterium]|nr:signal peptide peptidase SppA [Mycobacteriales bacterium]
MSRQHSAPILLELDLSHPLVEHEPDDPIAKLRSRGKPRLRPILKALHEAGDDHRVVGLVAKVGDTSMSLAHAQEIRDAVGAFAASGKPTIAWTDTFGESGNGTVPYFLATGFGEIWLQPTGELNLAGVVAEVAFLRGALDKLGVEPQIGQRYEYKNAADRIVATGFTDAHREALDRIAGSAWEQITEAIAKARGLAVDEVSRLADRAPLFADEALAARLVDHAGYRDEVYAAARRGAGGDVRLLFADRWSPNTSPVTKVVRRVRDKDAPGVALVDGFGGIVTGRSRRSPLQGRLMGSYTVAAAIRAAVSDEKTRAIVFRVDSPGGSAVASDTIWREVACARQSGKPVVVSMGAVAGSGGYYVACNADQIVAQPGTLTGSIGVLGGKPVTTGLTDRLGLRYDAVQRGAHARLTSTHVPYDDSQRERLEAMLDRVYDDFTRKVADGRGMSREAVHDVARGRVWTGADAAGIGLVDTLGGLRDAARIARSRAGLPPDAPVRPAVSVPMLARLKPPRSSDDPRAAAGVSTSAGSLSAEGLATATVAAATLAAGSELAAWFDGWGPFADLARALGLPALGPLTMLPVTLR